MLKDRFDYSNEPDEPLDPELNKDDLYDEDQFYRESEAIPPAPKLHRELSNSAGLVPAVGSAAGAGGAGGVAGGAGLGGSGDIYDTQEQPSSSANPPMRSREGNHLEGMYNGDLPC